MLDKKNKVYKLGIVAPRTFCDLGFLEELLKDKLDYVSHIVTNNVVSGGETVQTFAKKATVPFTVFPVPHKVGGALISNSQIVQNSDFVYVIADGESENANNVCKECDKKQRKYKLITYVPKETLPI